jgi:hypothetical protein
MTTRLTALALLAAAALAGCETTPPLGYGPEPTTTAYTEPADSGLLAVRPYPTPNDVCQVIGENDATRDLLDDSSLLIACPKHEKGALEDRMAEGARVVGHARHWTLLQVPL